MAHCCRGRRCSVHGPWWRLRVQRLHLCCIILLRSCILRHQRPVRPKAFPAARHALGGGFRCIRSLRGTYHGPCALPASAMIVIRSVLVAYQAESKQLRKRGCVQEQLCPVVLYLSPPDLAHDGARLRTTYIMTARQSHPSALHHKMSRCHTCSVPPWSLRRFYCSCSDLTKLFV